MNFPGGASANGSNALNLKEVLILHATGFDLQGVSQREQKLFGVTSCPMGRRDAFQPVKGAFPAGFSGHGRQSVPVVQDEDRIDAAGTEQCSHPLHIVGSAIAPDGSARAEYPVQSERDPVGAPAGCHQVAPAQAMHLG